MHILETCIGKVVFLYMFYLVHVRQQVVQVSIDVIIIPSQLHLLHNANLVEFVQILGGSLAAYLQIGHDEINFGVRVPEQVID